MMFVEIYYFVEKIIERWNVDERLLIKERQNVLPEHVAHQSYVIYRSIVFHLEFPIVVYQIADFLLKVVGYRFDVQSQNS